MNERGFPAGYWHAEDSEALVEVMRESLADLGVPERVVAAGISAARAASEPGGITEKEAEEWRRRQTLAAAEAVNELLARGDDPRRLVAVDGHVGEDCTHILLAPQEQATLRRVGLLRD